MHTALFPTKLFENSTTDIFEYLMDSRNQSQIQHLQQYVNSFLKDEPTNREDVAGTTDKLRLRRGYWLDTPKEEAFLRKALVNFENFHRGLEGKIYFQPNSSIPRVFHHIWLGSPLPERFQALRATWLRHHPEEDGRYLKGMSVLSWT